MAQPKTSTITTPTCSWPGCRRHATPGIYSTPNASSRCLKHAVTAIVYQK